jgi:L-serine dehydratase
VFISVLDLFKVGVGPSSSHTMGPMLAARRFLTAADAYASHAAADTRHSIHCTLRGSLAYTGHGHGTARAIVLGLHGYSPVEAAGMDIDELGRDLWQAKELEGPGGSRFRFDPAADIHFDRGEPLPQHPNGMIFELRDAAGSSVLRQIVFSVGGGFIVDAQDFASARAAPGEPEPCDNCPYGFASVAEMVAMAERAGKSVADMKYANETVGRSVTELDRRLDEIWDAMRQCVRSGLSVSGELPGGLKVQRRAQRLAAALQVSADASRDDWLCAYAMAVNEENAAGHLVVTAPTNGAAGVVPAVLFYLVEQQGIGSRQVHEFLLTAAAVGGLIKHNSSISGAEVGCQGEVGSASAMAAAGLCAVKGGTVRQIEKAAEIALEHHLGMTCDPVQGLVQIPCIERNGFGAVKAWSAASLALHEGESHHVSLDACIAAMERTGREMSHKYKETSLGGLAVSYTEC